jgi:hypothetical protein
MLFKRRFRVRKGVIENEPLNDNHKGLYELSIVTPLRTVHGCRRCFGTKESVKKKRNCQSDTLTEKLANGPPPPKKKQEKKKAKLRKKHTLVSSQALDDPLTKNLPPSSSSQPHVPANSDKKDILAQGRRNRMGQNDIFGSELRIEILHASANHPL